MGLILTRESEFSAGIREIVNLFLCGVHTAFPARFESYDETTKRAEIQPCLQRKYFNSDPSNLPKITDVPVIFLSTGNLHVICPPKSGSYGLAICSERAIDLWLTKGGIVDPADPRKFELTDCFIIPGIFPLPSAAGILPVSDSDAIEIRNSAGDSILRVTESEIQLQCGTTPTPAEDYAVRYNELETAFNQLKQDLNTFISVFNAHTQPVSGGTAGAPSIPGVSSAAIVTPAKVDNVRLPAYIPV